MGAGLREAREARGIELAEVERVTKIRARFLAAIEAERWELLPGRAYANAFVRTYAGFLGIDPAPLAAQLHRDLDPGEHEEEIPPEPIVQRGVLPTGLRRWMSLRAIAAALGAAAAITVVALAIAGGQGDDEPASSPTAPDSEQPTGGTEASEAEQQPEVEPPVEPEAHEPERVSLALDATGTVWVCLVDGRGEALVAGETLVEGTRRGPFEARRLLMTLGNGQIELTTDGESFDVPEAAEPLGFEVTAEEIRELEPTDRPTCA